MNDYSTSMPQGAHRLELIGRRPMRIFHKGVAPYEVQPGDDLSFLL